MSQDTKQNIADNAVRIAIDSGDWGCVEILTTMGGIIKEADIAYAKKKFPDKQGLVSKLEKALLNRKLSSSKIVQRISI